MNETLERHAERLTDAERQKIWSAISRARAGARRPGLRWALAGAAVVLVAGAITLAVALREPTAPRSVKRGEVPSSARKPPHVDAVERLDHVARVKPKATRTRALAETARRPSRAARRTDPIVPIARDQVALPALPESIPQVLVMPPGLERRSRYASRPPESSGPTGAVMGVVRGEHREPIPYANVVVLGMKGRGTQTDDNGSFKLDRVPVGNVQIQLQALGYDKQVRSVEVSENATATVDFGVGSSKVVKTIDEIQVSAEKRVDRKSSTTTHSLSAERLKGLPVDNLRESVAKKAGVVTQGGELFFRGGRSGEVKVQLDGSRVGPTPVIPTTGGTTLPNDEVYDSMFFRTYGVNPFIATDEDSLSTFAVDVDAGSYTLTRRYIELGHLPPMEAVRVEEFINFFPQGYPKFEDDDFRILVDGAPSPFGRGYHLLRIGLKGREIAPRDRKPAQLTFVIDVSGSMAREDRLELVKRALRLLVDQLRDDDRVGIVVYDSQGRVILEPTAIEKAVPVAGRVRDESDDREEYGPRSARAGRRRILDAIDALRPGGSTNAEEGLQLGYDMARRGYRQEAINRIVLCSDGVANVGRTGPESILGRVRSEADRGIHLSAIGFGMGNYNDVLMEQLADKGDGNYYYVDDFDEACRVFVENLTGTLQTIAKDAKVQVEFDPSRVQRYRLLGFENRDVADRDFRNDKVDAGEIGVGHEVTALYEVKLAGRAGDRPIGTVRLRYARPEHEVGASPEVREIAKEIRDSSLRRTFEEASPHLRLDAAVAEFAEILRGSYWAKDGRLSDALIVARVAAGSLRLAPVDELVTLIEKSTRLSRSLRPEERKGDR